MPKLRLPQTPFRAIVALLLACAFATTTAQAADPVPEVQRAPYPPKANGEVHTIRIIPEACVYLHGMFTGDKALPYRYGAKRNSARCQPRAQMADPAKATPSVASGWILNDIVRVPSAACLTQTAVIRVWRKPADNAPPPPDAQGRSRIYLEEFKQRAAQGSLAPVTKFAAVLSIEGATCK
jgi:predicted outer membrane lipoprotein